MYKKTVGLRHGKIRGRFFQNFYNRGFQCIRVYVMATCFWKPHMDFMQLSKVHCITTHLAAKVMNFRNAFRKNLGEARGRSK